MLKTLVEAQLIFPFRMKFYPIFAVYYLH